MADFYLSLAIGVTHQVCYIGSSYCCLDWILQLQFASELLASRRCRLIEAEIDERRERNSFAFPLQLQQFALELAHKRKQSGRLLVFASVPANSDDSLKLAQIECTRIRSAVFSLP